MTSDGDNIYVNDFGVCKLNEDSGKSIVYLVEEEDNSINWYINPERSDEVLLHRKVDLIEKA